MPHTFYPKTIEALNAIYLEHIHDNTDMWCSSHALPEWIDKAPTPDGQSKVIDRDGNLNLDPCRIILSDDVRHIQIEVPLTIYDEWIDSAPFTLGARSFSAMIREGLDPRTGNPVQ